MEESRNNPYTISQLIEELSKYPPDTRVMIHGYEDGFNDCNGVGFAKVKLNVNTEWYSGAHDLHDSYHARNMDKPIIDVVII